MCLSTMAASVDKCRIVNQAHSNAFNVNEYGKEMYPIGLSSSKIMSHQSPLIIMDAE